MKNEKGQSLVELAISLVVILLLLSGAVEFGLAYFQMIQLRDAAQEGALYGSICPTHLEQIEYRVRVSSSSPLDLTREDVKVEIKVSSDTPTSGDEIKVSVIYVHKTFMPFLLD